MPQLPTMRFAERSIHLGKQHESRFGDSDLNPPAIVSGSFSIDESSLGQLVEHPRDVRSFGNQTLPQSKCRDSFGVSSPQEAEDVVLLRGEAIRNEEFVLDRPKAIIGPPEIQIRFLLG